MTTVRNRQNFFKIVRKLMKFFHPIGFVFEVLAYKLGRTKPPSKFLITSHLFIGGKLGSLASSFLGTKKQQIEGVSSLVFLENPLDLQQLNDLGYALVPNAISKDTVHEILEFSLQTKGNTRNMDSGTGFEKNLFFDRNDPKTVRFDYEPDEILKSPLIQNLVCDPVILDIAQEYLGALPVFDFVAMWWHVKSDSPDKEAAQYFHFDMDRLRWIKFFFYITDVNKDSGPHMFVPKSHRDGALPFKLRSKGYTRLSDEEVTQYFHHDTWKEFTGQSGTMIVEDTRGLHKGKHVNHGDRLVFQIQYTSSLFGNKIPKMNLSRKILSPKLEKSLSTYPKIYQQLNIV